MDFDLFRMYMMYILAYFPATSGKNLAEPGQLLNKPPGDLSLSDAFCIEFDKVAVEHLNRTNFIKELIEVKHGNLDVNIFFNDELEQIVDFLCTS